MVSVDAEFLNKLKQFNSYLSTQLDSIDSSDGVVSPKQVVNVSLEEKKAGSTHRSATAPRRRDSKLDLSNMSEEVKKVCESIPPKWANNLKTVLFSQQKIEAKLKEMALKISHDYKGKKIVAVGLLTGCVMFQINLLKYLTVPYEMDFIQVSSYGKGTTSSGNVKLKKDLSTDPEGKHILITEDLIDTGRTLKFISKYFSDKKCASIKIACLLSKAARRKERSVKIDYYGFDCPDEFVIGYGMDFADEYRALPFVGVLKESAYSHLT